MIVTSHTTYFDDRIEYVIHAEYDYVFTFYKLQSGVKQVHISKFANGPMIERIILTEIGFDWFLTACQVDATFISSTHKLKITKSFEEIILERHPADGKHKLILEKKALKELWICLPELLYHFERLDLLHINAVNNLFETGFGLNRQNTL